MINEMKQMNGHTKRCPFWINGMNILCLLTTLQAFSCPPNAKGLKHKVLYGNITDYMVKSIAIETFKKQTAGIDISEPVQNKEGIPKRTYIYAAVRARDKEKLKYVVERIDKDIKEGKCSHPNVLNLPDESSGKTPLIRAIEAKQPELVEILLTGPNIHITEEDAKDAKGRSPLHMAAFYNNIEAFKLIWNKIFAKEEASAAKHLFEKDKQEKTVFASAYLPQPGFLRPNNNIEMFKKILEVVKDSLQRTHLDNIIAEIMGLQHKKTISEKYSSKLQNPVNLIIHPKQEEPSTKK